MVESLLHSLAQDRWRSGPELTQRIKSTLEDPVLRTIVPLDGRLMMSPQACNHATPAAVLIALIPRLEGLQVMLTRRTDHLNDHAGQISFPGGKRDPQDRSPEQTALREAREEVGLKPSQIQVLGSLQDYFIPTGYRVTPVVGWIQPPFQLQCDPFEVAEAFEAPLSWFLDPSRHILQQDISPQGQPRQYFAFSWKHYSIWGATAGMLIHFYQVLQRSLH